MRKSSKNLKGICDVIDFQTNGGLHKPFYLQFFSQLLRKSRKQRLPSYWFVILSSVPVPLPNALLCALPLLRLRRLRLWNGKLCFRMTDFFSKPYFFEAWKFPITGLKNTFLKCYSHQVLKRFCSYWKSVLYYRFFRDLIFWSKLKSLVF